MYNRLYEYPTKNNLLFDKQFEFKKGHSTEHALMELVNRIYDSFNENKYTLGVFINRNHLIQPREVVAQRCSVKKVFLEFLQS